MHHYGFCLWDTRAMEVLSGSSTGSAAGSNDTKRLTCGGKPLMESRKAVSLYGFDLSDYTLVDLFLDITQFVDPSITLREIFYDHASMLLNSFFVLRAPLQLCAQHDEWDVYWSWNVTWWKLEPRVKSSDRRSHVEREMYREYPGRRPFSTRPVAAPCWKESQLGFRADFGFVTSDRKMAK